MPLSDNTIDVLKKVKRGGQTAWFVVAAKSGKVHGLVVYLKGSRETAIKEAKGDLGGQVSYGIVAKPETCLLFQLSEAEQFTTNPTTTKALREYLNAEKDIDTKADYQIVPVLPTALQSPTADTADPGRPQLAPYVTQDQWAALIGKLKAADGAEREEFGKKLYHRLEAEALRLRNDTELRANDPTLAGEMIALYTKLNAGLQAFAPAPQPPAPPQIVADEDEAPQRLRRPGRVLRRPPARPQSAPPTELVPDPNKETRAALRNDASVRATKIEASYNLNFYRKGVRDKVLKETNTDSKSDFYDVIDQLAFTWKAPLEEILPRMEKAKALADKYVASHKAGDGPDRVQARRAECLKISSETAAYIDQIQIANSAARDMEKVYREMTLKKQPMPIEAADSLERTAELPIIATPLKNALTALAEQIREYNRFECDRQLAELQNPTPEKRAEVLDRYGQFKQPNGGTSDIKLLKTRGGAVEFAFKSADGESEQALEFLGLQPGACSVREEMSSVLGDILKAETGLDLGFPKSRLVSLNGVQGALIEGIAGETLDPETVMRLNGEDQQQLFAAINSVPDRITPDSLANVVLFSTLTGQWDCKWGNMMVEGDRARPIDAGTAFPTQTVIDKFKGIVEEGGKMSLRGVIEYPNAGSNPRRGTTMPQAQQPLDPKIVGSLQKMDPKRIGQLLIAHRDNLTKSQGAIGALVPNDCILRSLHSLAATKRIVDENPNLTLEQFVTQYELWFNEYVSK